MRSMQMAYYRDDLALVHHRGFGAHAENCAPGILDLLAPIKGSTILELGCGSGLLTKKLSDAGHHVIATDASSSMLALLEQQELKNVETRLIRLPGGLPQADAIVSVGHVLNYLPDAGSIDRTWSTIAQALTPGGLLAVDICDLEWGRARRDTKLHAKTGDDWAIITEFARPRPDLYVREITTFVQTADGTYRRDHERHDNVLVDTSGLPAKLVKLGLDVSIGKSFGNEEPLVGLYTVIGHKQS